MHISASRQHNAGPRFSEDACAKVLHHPIMGLAVQSNGSGIRYFLVFLAYHQVRTSNLHAYKHATEAAEEVLDVQQPFLPAPKFCTSNMV